MRSLSVVVAVLVGLVEAAIIGEPKIRCSPEGVQVMLEMDKPFSGSLYLRGTKERRSCKASFSDTPLQNITHQFPFDSCPSRRKRQLLPPKGMIMSSVLVVSYHGAIITHKDVAYQIDCFYKEQHSHVFTSINVSAPAPQQLSGQPSLPKCEYNVELSSITSKKGGVTTAVGGPGGLPTVAVGDAVVHIWSCAGSAPTDVYCMQVHNCLAEDGDGEKVQVVDDQGCSTDGELLSPIRYAGSLRAVATSQAFMFADHQAVYFKCAVKLFAKNPADECPMTDCTGPRNRTRRAARTVVEFVVESPEVRVEPQPTHNHVHVNANQPNVVLWPRELVHNTSKCTLWLHSILVSAYFVSLWV